MMSEQHQPIERTPLWKKIHEILDQIPQGVDVGYTLDAPSVATKIEELINPINVLAPRPKHGDFLEEEDGNGNGVLDIAAYWNANQEYIDDLQVAISHFNRINDETIEWITSDPDISTKYLEHVGVDVEKAVNQGLKLIEDLKKKHGI